MNHLATAPLKFRTLKLLGCTCRHAQLLIEACAKNLEDMDFWYSIGASFRSRQRFPPDLNNRRSPLSSTRLQKQHQAPKAGTQNASTRRHRARCEVVIRNTFDYHLGRVHKVDHSRYARLVLVSQSKRESSSRVERCRRHAGSAQFVRRRYFGGETAGLDDG